METKSNIRMDKWLWAVRIFKTRSMAADACKKGKVLIDDSNVKPSHTVKIGQIISVKQPPLLRTFKVIGLVEKRLPAKLVENFMEELTPPEEFDKIKLIRSTAVGIRDRGTGRPTKKERRDIEKLSSNDWVELTPDDDPEDEELQ